MWRNLLLFLLTLLFWIVFPVWVLVFNLKFFYTNPDFFKTALAKAHIYETILDLVPVYLDENLKAKLEELKLELPPALLPSDISDYLLEIVSPSYLQSQVEMAIDGLFTALFTEEKPQLVISTAEPKSKVLSTIRKF